MNRCVMRAWTYDIPYLMGWKPLWEKLKGDPRDIPQLNQNLMGGNHSQVRFISRRNLYHLCFLA